MKYLLDDFIRARSSTPKRIRNQLWRAVRFDAGDCTNLAECLKRHMKKLALTRRHRAARMITPEDRAIQRARQNDAMDEGAV